MLLSYGVDAWKLEEGEAASLCAKWSVGAQPSPLVSPQLEKLLPLVMGSRAPPSDMTGATAPPLMPAMWSQADVRTPWPIRAWPVPSLLGLGLGRPKSLPLWELLILSTQPFQLN